MPACSSFEVMVSRDMFGEMRIGGFVSILDSKTRREIVIRLRSLARYAVSLA